MGQTDDQLDATSRRLLNEIEELRRLELKKRRTARSSDEFHELAGQVDNAARHAFETASTQLIEGDEESPIESERQEQRPGDWTDGSTEPTGPQTTPASTAQARSSNLDR